MTEEDILIQKLFNTYYAAMWRYALSIVKTHPLADDITQQAFLKLYEHRSLLLTLDSIQQKAYLSTTLRNTAYTAVQPHKQPEIDPGSMREESAEDTAFRLMEMDTPVLIERVLQALPQLPERYRQVLSLRYDMDLSYKEVAQAFGTTENNARQIAFQARYTLRKLLETEGTNNED